MEFRPLFGRNHFSRQETGRPLSDQPSTRDPVERSFEGSGGENSFLLFLNCTAASNEATATTVPGINRNQTVGGNLVLKNLRGGA